MELKKETKPEQLKSHAASSSRKRDTEEGKKKISFIEQANKRKECDKLAAFVMSIDLMLNHVLHQLVVNSMTTIQVRSPRVPESNKPDSALVGFDHSKTGRGGRSQTEGEGGEEEESVGRRRSSSRRRRHRAASSLRDGGGAGVSPDVLQSKQGGL